MADESPESCDAGYARRHVDVTGPKGDPLRILFLRRQTIRLAQAAKHERFVLVSVDVFPVPGHDRDGRAALFPPEIADSDEGEDDGVQRHRQQGRIRGDGIEDGIEQGPPGGATRRVVHECLQSPTGLCRLNP